MANRLINETSPYLLQHAHNPVDWYPWGEEAINKAKEENKPILVSIGYAACHWCHVMERESFEMPETAALMNEHFVNIKIDREERPDLDHIYMDAVQAMTGSGGWPLNVFLTPDLKPFYGGTYFPPRPIHQRNSWSQVLEAVAAAFHEKKDEIAQQAAQLTSHLQQSNAFGMQNNSDAKLLFSHSSIADAVNNSLKLADREWGGFSRAPKFPQTFIIQFLLRASQHLAEKGSVGYDDQSQQALHQALFSLDKMIEGGIYDQLGGGLARYSTDTEWLAPHFEKMLYDNALFVSVLSEAYQLTKKERYKEVIAETIAFVQLELMHPRKGFYAALDADSEGEEGKFYVWSKKEIDQILGEDSVIFNAWYDVREEGNWEGKNILRVLQPVEKFAEEHNMTVDALQQLLVTARKKLMSLRAGRPRPLLDDKVILGWNALMNTALSKAFAATGEEQWKLLAVDNMEFLLKNLDAGSGAFHHTWKNDQARIPAFLDDYAWLMQALIQLSEVTGNLDYLRRAENLALLVNDRFGEDGTGYYYYTPEGQSDIIVRKKEVYDGATPSGNAVMAENLHRLGILFDRPEWMVRSEKMLLALGQAIIRYPTSFGYWNNILLEKIHGTAEIAIVGGDYAKMRSELLKEFLPHRVLMAIAEADPTFPLLAGKEGGEAAQIYVCRNFACERPVTTTEAAISLINSVATKK
ncbi:MAG: thioredoxin domain-containing protein [Chitinophagaceae bacterium]|nr:thioredoxin domain-containing protein [Chitinophagaceae bacterium]